MDGVGRRETEIDKGREKIVVPLGDNIDPWASMGHEGQVNEKRTWQFVMPCVARENTHESPGTEAPWKILDC